MFILNRSFYLTRHQRTYSTYSNELVKSLYQIAKCPEFRYWKIVGLAAKIALTNFKIGALRVKNLYLKATWRIISLKKTQCNHLRDFIRVFQRFLFAFNRTSFTLKMESRLYYSGEERNRPF